MFDAHGIAVIVGAQHHAGLLAGLGGSFVSLDIWVAGEDRDDALALLRDLHEPVPGDGDGDGDGDPDGDIPAEGGPGNSELATAIIALDLDESDGDVRWRIDRRRRTGIVLLLSCCLTFGTGHMFARAWPHGFALAVLELIGVMQLWAGNQLGGIAVAVAIAADLVGAMWRVRAPVPPGLPVARLRSAS
jgi:hypothetical protein